MKKYRNVIILGVVLVAVAVYLCVKFVNFSDLLLTFGYFDDKVTVVNTADMHGHLVYDDDVGGYYSLEDVNVIMGMPLIKTLIEEEKAKNKEKTLVFDCGDTFHGPNEGCMNKGEASVECAKLMGIDAAVPGNHDFNYGIKRFFEISNEINYPIIASNIYKDGKLAFDEYKIYDVGGKKVAVFGLVFKELLDYSDARDFEDVSIEDPVKVAEKLIPELRKKADVVILLSHMGPNMDEELAAKVSGIDMILSSHLHDIMKTPKVVNGTYIAEPGGWTTHIGVTNFYFKGGKLSKIKWELKNSKDKEKADPKMDAIGQKYHAISYEEQKEVIGKTNTKLIGMRTKARTQEINLGNLMTDAMREAAKADIALLNGGGIRQSLEEGDVRVYDIGKVMPFDNRLVTLELKGETIYEILEKGLDVYPMSYNGGFQQVSGINYEFDASKPAGKRLVKVTKDGKPLDKEKNYKVATNDYLYKGGDSMKMLVGQKQLDSGALLKDIVIEYFKKNKTVNPKVEGRIKVLNERYS